MRVEANMAMNKRKFLKSVAGVALMAGVTGGESMATGETKEGSSTATENKKRWTRIATEEGFTVPEIIAESARMAKLGRPVPNPLATPQPTNAAKELFGAMLDLEEDRLRLMDKAGVAKQLLLLGAPGVQGFDEGPAVELAKLVNDRIAETIKKHPTRFAALTVIAPQNPMEAAREFERGVKTLGFSGALINSHTRGEYLDDRKFWPIFEAAQAMDMPIYIHPREPVPGMYEPLEIDGFNVGWGYGVEVGTHILHLMRAGVFDEFPRLKIVIGHLGEALPYIIDRLDNRYAWEVNLRGLQGSKHSPSYYLRENISITTSGMNTWTPVKMAIETLGVDRIMFAIDYPFEVNQTAVDAMDAAPLSDTDREKFYHLNAERVFKLPAAL